MAEDKKYIETVGRRKTSIARVRLVEAGKSSYLINDRELAHYFPTADLQRIATEPFTKVKAPANLKLQLILMAAE
jgi:ribosomal protein S9